MNISQNTSVDLVVSEAGNAVLLYQGDINPSYRWAQFERDTKSVHFVSDDGVVDNLGLKINSKIETFLKDTTEVFLIQLDESYEPVNHPKVIKFIHGGADES